MNSLCRLVPETEAVVACAEPARLRRDLHRLVGMQIGYRYVRARIERAEVGAGS